MSVIFVEATEISLIEVYLSQKLFQNPLTILTQKDSSGLGKYKLSSLDDLQNLLQNQDIFDNNTNPSNPIYLLDYSNLEINKIFIDYLADFNQLPIDIYLYNLERGKLLAETKKLIKKSNLEILSLLKPEFELALEIAKTYQPRINLSLNLGDLQKIAKVSTNYQEILDNLDFIQLSNNPKLALQNLISDNDLPLFMLSLEPSKLQSQQKPWLEKVGVEEIQLALSLLFVKLMKNSTHSINKHMIQILILTDWKMKTQSHIPASTWYKAMFWSWRQTISKL